MSPAKDNPADALMIKRVGLHALEIHWHDGHVSSYSYEYLRAYCPCVDCAQRRTNRFPLPLAVSGSVFPFALRIVGRYGLELLWNDGHREGIYSFRTLRRLCPCSTCSAAPRLAT